MTKKKKKLSKSKLWAIISAGVVALIVIAILITNIFIPVKYFASYCVAENRVKSGLMRVSFIDVGFGDCTIIELPDGKNMLIDAGDGRYSNNAKVLKELNRRGIDEIDYLICSSVNNEHCGGFEEILKYKKIKTVYKPYCNNKYITDGFRAFCDASDGMPTIYSEYNTRVDADDYFFVFLSPSVKNLDGGEYHQLNTQPSKSARNNASAVLWLEYGETAFLFTSDVEKNVLNSIAQSYEIAASDYPVKLEKCKIVQVACHGYYNSACAAFYDLIAPEVAVISVGENGSGSPAVSVLSDVINSVGTNLYRTDERGNITIEVSPTGYVFN